MTSNDRYLSIAQELYLNLIKAYCSSYNLLDVDPNQVKNGIQ